MRIFAAVLVLLLPATALAQGLKTEEEKTVYALGVVIAKGLEDLQLTPEQLDLLKHGMTDGLTGKKLEVSLEEYGAKARQWARGRAQATRGEKAKARKEADKAYAESAAKEKGAVKTESGLVFIPIQEGTGPSPQATDTVKVHYEGKLTDGKTFDSSYVRKQPAEFPLKGVIPCWTEGVQKMKVGGKAKLVCPSSIAYGDNGRPPVIPGGATLVFEIELLEIKAAPAAAATSPHAPATK
jgi:FKBP-type peptidyl-prolyl cis-trans isomerase FkpA